MPRLPAGIERIDLIRSDTGESGCTLGKVAQAIRLRSQRKKCNGVANRHRLIIRFAAQRHEGNRPRKSDARRRRRPCRVPIANALHQVFLAGLIRLQHGLDRNCPRDATKGEIDEFGRRAGGGRVTTHSDKHLEKPFFHLMHRLTRSAIQCKVLSHQILFREGARKAH